MKRRSFLEKFSSVAAMLLTGLESQAFAFLKSGGFDESNRKRVDWLPPGRRVPVMQGVTTATSTQILILVPRSEPVRFKAVNANGSALKIAMLEQISGPNSRYMMAKIRIDDLKVGSVYTLQILSNRNEIIDERRFKALNTSSQQARFAIISCMDDRNSLQAEMWNEVVKQQPEFMFFIGDNVYVDSEDIQNSDEYIWQRYVETRMGLDIFQNETLIPVFSTWDDHDYADDDGDATFLFKPDSTKTFKAFFGNHDSVGFQNGPGVSSLLSAFGQRFVLLDGRSFKARERHGHQWGEEQEAWLRTVLDRDSKDPVWIFNGTQFFGRYHLNESVEKEAPEALVRLQKTLSLLKAPIVFGSGDVHYSEIMKVEANRLGYETWEFTSSSIHSTVADEMRPNPRRVYGVLNNNFMIMNSSVQKEELALEVSIHGGSGRVYHSSAYKVTKG